MNSPLPANLHLLDRIWKRRRLSDRLATRLDRDTTTGGGNHETLT